jgi:hypothetical protein
MNTIPSTFNEQLPPYTAIGGELRAGSSGLSAVILNRDGRFPRKTFFQELEKVGFDMVFSIESVQERYDIDELSEAFPFVRFIVPQEEINMGQEINLAVTEIPTPLFFVLWNDIRLLHSGGAQRIAERLYEVKGGIKRLCTVPYIQNSRIESLPTLVYPASAEGRFVIPPPVIPKEGMHSLYPYDGIGIYDRTRFTTLGGFDPGIGNFHWQLQDFGFRANLWGEEIALTEHVKLSFLGSLATDDVTVDEGFLRFYLKCLAPVFRGDDAHIPLRRFGRFTRLRRRSLGPDANGSLLDSWHDFDRGRRWVQANATRYRSDARLLADTWKMDEEHTDNTENTP